MHLHIQLQSANQEQANDYRCDTVFNGERTLNFHLKDDYSNL